MSAGRGARGPRLGFVGLGWIGAMRLGALASAEGGGAAAEAAALAEPDAARLDEAVARHPGAHRCATFEELLDAAPGLGLDGVVLATPNALHAPQAEAALERGLAVFSQKPLATTADEARAVVEAARRSDRLLGVDYTYRGLEGVAELARAVAAGELGRMVHLDAAFHNAYGPDKAWCQDVRVAGGGALLDLGVHLVDLALHLTGETRVEEVGGGARAGGQLLPGRGIDDFTTLSFRLADSGATVHAACSWHAHAGRDCLFRLALYGTGGGALVRNVGGSFFDFEVARFEGREERPVARDRGEAALARTFLSWVRRLARSPGFDPTAASSVGVAEVVDAVYARGAGAGEMN